MNALALHSEPRASELAPRERGEPLLTCRGLLIGHAGKPLLPALDVSVRRGEIWAVIGRNGSGKSTFMRSVLGLMPALDGEVRAERAALRLAYLAQRQSFDLLYPLLTRDVVAMGCERGNSFLRPRSGGYVERVRRALALCGASELERRPFRTLSEGQKQRVLFARVAAGKPDLALLDEPTSAMDQVAEREAFELLSRLSSELGMAIVIVSHYLGVVREYADRALLLDRDSAAVVSGTPREVLEHEVFQRRYAGAAPSVL